VRFVPHAPVEQVIQVLGLLSGIRRDDSIQHLLRGEESAGEVIPSGLVAAIPRDGDEQGERLKCLNDLPRFQIGERRLPENR